MEGRSAESLPNESCPSLALAVYLPCVTRNFQDFLRGRHVVRTVYSYASNHENTEMKDILP